MKEIDCETCILSDAITDCQGCDNYPGYIRRKERRYVARAETGKEIRPATIHEPKPDGKGDVVLFDVIKDLEARAETGKEKYGTYLRTKNGRNALMDAYQEALDLCMYLKQKLMEEE